MTRRSSTSTSAALGESIRMLEMTYATHKASLSFEMEQKVESARPRERPREKRGEQGHPMTRLSRLKTVRVHLP